MAHLMPLLKAAQDARLSFDALLCARFPGADIHTWYRALDAVEGGVGARNKDQSRDTALAADLDLKAADTHCTELLHAFYSARDGAEGLLARFPPVSARRKSK